AQVELAAIGVVGVDDINERLAGVGQAGEKLSLHVIELAAGDFVHAALAIETVGEELVRFAEFLGEERVDERDVVVDAADFENLVAAGVGLGVPVLAARVVVA